MDGQKTATLAGTTASGAAAGTAVFPGYGTAIGAGLGFIGGLFQVFGIQQEAKATAKAYAQNAQIAGDNARAALLQSYEDERRLRVTNRKALSKQYSDFVSMAGSGSASALDMVAESARNMELDALTVRYRGLVTAQNFINDARSAGVLSSQAKTAGNISAAITTIETGISTAQKIGEMGKA